MKYALITAASALLFFSCEQKETVIQPPDKNETTIVNPPAEKKETTIINPPASKTTEKTTETETKITPGGTTTEKTETIEKK